MCPTLCDPIDGSPPGSPVPRILQARTLEWVAISFSNAWKWKVKVKPLSHVRLLATPWTAAHQAPPSVGCYRCFNKLCRVIYLYLFDIFIQSLICYGANPHGWILSALCFAVKLQTMVWVCLPFGIIQSDSLLQGYNSSPDSVSIY